MREKNFVFNEQALRGKIEVVPAENGMGAKNCIRIKEGQILTAIEIEHAALNNDAMVKKTGRDRFDITYAVVVQFPGGKQELSSDYNELEAKLRKLSGEKVEE